MRNLFQQLDPGQFKAVTSESKYILCLAGAGSGKTRVLTARIFYLIKNLKIKPENILAITFTKNAAKEMLERLKKLEMTEKVVGLDKLWCRTFHSACFRILQEQDWDFIENLKVIDDETQNEIIVKCIIQLQKKKEFAYRLARFLEENNWPEYLFVEEILKIIKECKNRSIFAKDLILRCRNIKIEEVKDFYRLAIVIFVKYQNFLRKFNAKDYSDLINHTITLLKNNKKALEYYQNKFKYILVDEYQDVNYAQVNFLDLLLSGRNNLFVVGDDCQAIYGWRGGEVKYIVNFPKNYKNCEVIQLPYNYRSDGFIVEAANKVIKKNKNQHKKKIFAFNKRKEKIRILNNSDYKTILAEIKKLLKVGFRQKDIVILGRIWKTLRPYLENFPKEKLYNIKINTIHSAKGTESDIVFLIGLYKGRNGFPNIKDDSSILKVIRDASFWERLEEERRVFYVGMTRAKKILYLVTEKGNESQFLREIPGRMRIERRIGADCIVDNARG